jgi:hypothetical protein
MTFLKAFLLGHLQPKDPANGTTVPTDLAKETGAWLAQVALHRLLKQVS